MELINKNDLVLLTKEEYNVICGGEELSVASHVLRAASFTPLGICYWIGYGVSKVIGD